MNIHMFIQITQISNKLKCIIQTYVSCQVIKYCSVIADAAHKHIKHTKISKIDKEHGNNITYKTCFKEVIVSSESKVK